MSKPKVRCSSLDQLLSCPGSKTLVEALGCARSEESTAYDGNYIHHEAARRLVNAHGAIPPEGGLPPPDLPENYSPPPFLRWVPDWCVHRVLETAGADTAIEVESELAFEFDEFTLTGHCDASVVNADATELVFTDYKTGIVPVDAAEANWQIAGYSVLFKKQWPSLRKITGRIAQPRMAAEERVSEVVLEGEQLEGAAAFLEGKIKAALANPMMLETGQKQCRWCDAALRCPALEKETELMKLEITKEEIERLKAEPEAQALARIAVAKKLLEPRFKTGSELLKALMEQTGTAITMPDGTVLTLKDRAGIREITDKSEAFHRLAGYVKEVPGDPAKLEFVPGLLEEGQVLECVKFSIPDLEAKAAEVLSLPLESEKTESGKSKIADTIGEFVQQPTRRVLSIVP